MAIESANYQNSEGTIHDLACSRPADRLPLASNLLITCPLDLEAAMTRWIRLGTGCCVISALFAIALAAVVLAARDPRSYRHPDASALPDAIGVADTTPGRSDSRRCVFP